LATQSIAVLPCPRTETDSLFLRRAQLGARAGEAPSSRPPRPFWPCRVCPSAAEHLSKPRALLSSPAFRGPRLRSHRVRWWPTRRSSWGRLISASCKRLGNSLRANSAKAREKVASLQTSARRSQPHSRLNCLPTVSRSINIEVVDSPITALATKARASAARSHGGPGSPDQNLKRHHHLLVRVGERPEFLPQPGKRLR
jgi:hypothetical protein